ALVEPPALLDDQERVGGLPLTTEDVVVARLVTRRGGAAQVTQRASRHPDQEEEEHGEKAELERYRQRLERGLHCPMSNAKTLVPRVISSPGERRALATRRPFTLTPLVELRSTICQSPTSDRRSSAWRREMLGSSMMQSHSFDRPRVAVGPSST